jgi:hypothetical protein
VIVADLMHFLNMPDETPGLARRLGQHLGNVVRAGTTRQSGQTWVSALPCRRRPNHKACPGTIAICRVDLPSAIEWRCTICGDSGVISGWEGSYFDLRARHIDSTTTPTREVSVPNDVASTLRGIQIFDRESERMVFRARAEHGSVVLEGSDDNLESMAEFVAAEANHEPNRRRQKRLDDAFAYLSDTLGGGTLDRSDSTSKFAGRWRIEESDLWDQDALDLVGPACIEFCPDRTGSLRFIAVEGLLDWRASTIEGRPGVEFSWEGMDDGSRVSGRGSAVLLDDEQRLHVHVYFHMGDDSGFHARPY